MIEQDQRLSVAKVRHTIRSITEQDVVAYHALRLAGLEEYPEAFGETVEHFKKVSTAQTVERLKASESRGGFILGAFSNEGILHGVVGLAREDGEKMEHRARIWGMYVGPSARKMGVGKSLMKECLEKAGQISGLEQVHLCVVTSNKAAVKLYTSLGFESYGTDPRVLKVDGQVFDEYLMVKMLRNNS